MASDRADHHAADARTDVRRELDLPVRGSFDLAQSIGFGFGQRAATDGPVLRLAFCLDDLSGQAAVALRQTAPDRLALEVVGDAGLDLDAVRAQVARVLSVDLDASSYDELGRRDPLVGRVQAARPGLRPPLFHSAYEAALWSVLSARQPAAQMVQVRARLSRDAGRTFAVAGQEVAAVPLPEQLTALTGVAGVPERKVEQLRAIGAAALAGRLDTRALRALAPAEAIAQLRQLPGIGPFYAELVVVRALGHADVLALQEPMVRALVGQLVGAAADLPDDQLTQVADAWRPWRTWVQVGIRAGAEQLGLRPPARSGSARRGPRGRGGAAA